MTRGAIDLRGCLTYEFTAALVSLFASGVLLSLGFALYGLILVGVYWHLVIVYMVTWYVDRRKRGERRSTTLMGLVLLIGQSATCLYWFIASGAASEFL